jgi:hypothetical protein
MWWAGYSQNPAELVPHQVSDVAGKLICILFRGCCSTLSKKHGSFTVPNFNSAAGTDFCADYVGCESSADPCRISDGRTDQRQKAIKLKPLGHKFFEPIL